MLPREVAEVLRINVKTLARWANTGRIECIVLPSGHRRFRREVVRVLVEGKKR